MAFLFGSAFELDEATDTWPEFETASGPGIPIWQTGGAHSGDHYYYSWQRGAFSSANYFENSIYASDTTNKTVWASIYFKNSQVPSTNDTPILRITNAAGSICAQVKILTSTQTLQLFDSAGSVGSASSINNNEWTLVQIQYTENTAGGAGTATCKLFINNVEVASKTTSANVSIQKVGFGAMAGNTTCICHFDDLVVNDNQGSAMTTRLGHYYVAQIMPDAVGSSTQWTLGAGTGDNYLQVDESNIDDASTYVEKLPTGNFTDMYGTTVVGPGTHDTIHCVALSGRIGATSNTNSTGREMEFLIASANGGTQFVGTSVNCAINGFLTHDKNAPQTYKCISYTDPTTGVAWRTVGTNSLENMEIGVRNTVSNGADIRLTTIWALVVYSPRFLDIIGSGNTGTVPVVRSATF